jgi:hypothetical protein
MRSRRLQHRVRPWWKIVIEIATATVIETGTAIVTVIMTATMTETTIIAIGVTAIATAIEN